MTAAIVVQVPAINVERGVFRLSTRRAAQSGNRCAEGDERVEEELGSLVHGGARRLRRTERRGGQGGACHGEHGTACCAQRRFQPSRLTSWGHGGLAARLRRMDSPFSAILHAPCIKRSRMTSASVGSPNQACQAVGGN